MKYNYEIDQILITAGDDGVLTVADLAWHEGSVPVPGHCLGQQGLIGYIVCTQQNTDQSRLQLMINIFFLSKSSKL